MKAEQEKANQANKEEEEKTEKQKSELVIKIIFEFPGVSLYSPNQYNPYLNSFAGLPHPCPHGLYPGLMNPGAQLMNSQFNRMPINYHPQPNFLGMGNHFHQNHIFPRENFNHQRCPFDNQGFIPVIEQKEVKHSQGTNTDFNYAPDQEQLVDQLHEENGTLIKGVTSSKHQGNKEWTENSKANQQGTIKSVKKDIDCSEEDSKNQLQMYNQKSDMDSKLEFSDGGFSNDDDNNSGNFDEKAAEIRLTHFENLNKLLILIFSGVEITENEWNLTKMEEKILNSVLKRKFYNKVQNDGIQLDETNKFNFINQLAKISTLKRPKDCYKMLLSRLFRILKQNYFEKNKFSNQNVYLFYQYYFGDLAKKDNIPIQSFFYPFERNNKFISLFPKISHHLNFRYYERIFKSEKFATDIKTVLNKVYSDHFSELKFKFSTLLKKWERFFYNFDNDDAMVEKTILKYLQFNNRCKIPFTVSEIENSIALFERMISKFEN